MSGIEVAGIILGALPVAISAVNGASKGIVGMRKFFTVRSELLNLQMILDTEHQLFLGTMQILLCRSLESNEASVLLEEPTSELWLEKTVQERVKVTLGTSHAVCCKEVANLKSAIQELRGRLGLFPENLLGNTKQELKIPRKLRFNLSRATYEDLVIRIQGGNERLRKLVDQSAILANVKVQRKKPTDVRSLREYATCIHDVLDASLHCECRSFHMLCLALDGAIESHVLDFDHGRRAFLLAPNYKSATAATGKAPIDFELMDADKAKDHVPCTIDQLRQIQSLCDDIHVLFQSQDSQSFRLIEDAQTKNRHLVRLAQSSFCNTVSGEMYETISLRTFITEKRNPRAAIRGSVKRRLALLMASSVLQLHKTPWLRAQWNQGDVLFLKRSDGRIWETPFVPKGLHGSDNAGCESSSQTSGLANVRNASIYALGIFLIELCLGSSLEDLKEDEDKVQGGALSVIMTEFKTAKRLIPVIYEEAGRSYGDAVRRCIWCDFDQMTYDLEDDAFCKAFHRGVVVPLEKNIENMDGSGAK